MNKKYNWKEFEYKLNKGEILTEYILEKAFNQYWDENISNLDEDQLINCQFQVGVGIKHLSISKVQTLNNLEYNELLLSFKKYLEMKIHNEWISGTELKSITSIIFNYKLIDKKLNITFCNI